MRSKSKYFLYVCDECGYSDIYPSDAAAREVGWSVSSSYYPFFPKGSHDSYFRKRCWCSDCAVDHHRGRPKKSK